MANGGGFYSTSMRHYQEACLEDPKLSINNEKFQQRMKSMVQGFHSPGREEGNSSTLIPSFDTIKEATACIREINNLAAEEILAYKQDIGGNAQILAMVNSYFELCKTTLDSLRTLTVRLRCTINELMAFRGDRPVNEKVRKAVTFAEGAVDCFFLSLPGLIRKHVQVLHMLQLARDKEMPTRVGRAKNPTARRVITIMLWTVFAGAVIFSILAASLHAPPLLAMLPKVVIWSWSPFVKWVDGFWAITEETKGVAAGEKRIVVIRELEDIKLLTVWNGDRAVEDVLKTMAELSEQVEKCYDEICMARRNFLQKLQSPRGSEIALEYLSTSK